MIDRFGWGSDISPANKRKPVRMTVQFVDTIDSDGTGWDSPWVSKAPPLREMMNAGSDLRDFIDIYTDSEDS